jgi:hypothetical protein
MRRTGRSRKRQASARLLPTHLLTRLPGTGETRRATRNADRIGAQLATTPGNTRDREDVRRTV